MDMTWLEKIAPTVATALGGPLGGVAATMVGKALGWEEATPAKVQDLLQSGELTAEQVAAIRTAELQLKQHESDNGFKFAELEIRDRDSARQREVAVKDRIPGILGLAITVGFFGVLTYMLKFGIAKEAGGEALLVMLGALGTSFGAIISYYFGSTSGSRAKDDVIKGLAGK